MRWIVPATCCALPSDQPIDSFPRFRGKGLRALDLGYETLELRDVLDLAAGRTHENSNKSDDERCGVTPVWQQWTVVGAPSLVIASNISSMRSSLSRAGERTADTRACGAGTSSVDVLSWEGIELNLAAGKGLTAVSQGAVFKAIFGYTFGKR